MRIPFPLDCSLSMSAVNMNVQLELLMNVLLGNTIVTSNCISNPVLFVCGSTEDNSLTLSRTLLVGAAMEVSPQAMCSNSAVNISVY